MKKIKYIFLLIVLLGLDQITKLWAKASFADGDSLTIIPKVLKVIYHENDGAAWGLFSGKTVFLCLLTAVAVVLFIYFFLKLPRNKKYNPLRILTVCVMAGAIGNNLIDRIAYGHVIDFIYFELIDFPVFNVADIYITVSVAVFALLALVYYKEDELDFLSKKKESSSIESEETNGKSE